MTRRVGEDIGAFHIARRVMSNGLAVSSMATGVSDFSADVDVFQPPGTKRPSNTRDRYTVGQERAATDS